MSKKILVRTPQTTDGNNLRYDENKQVVYAESIVEAAAQKEFESLNTILPEHLRHEFKEIEDEVPVAPVVNTVALAEAQKTIEETKSLLAENEKVVADKDDEIAYLKKQLEEAKKAPVVDLLKDEVKAATTASEVKDTVKK
jgi:5'-deoxynucleotidase YfbR-like HD superfamily hydrolase